MRAASAAANSRGWADDAIDSDDEISGRSTNGKVCCRFDIMEKEVDLSGLLRIRREELGVSVTVMPALRGAPCPPDTAVKACPEGKSLLVSISHEETPVGLAMPLMATVEASFGSLVPRGTDAAGAAL